MKVVDNPTSGASTGTLKSKELDWTAYALKYDLMCSINPSYQENIDLLLEHMSSWDLPENASICDLGAGTGNFITAIAKKYPDFRYTHVDSDAAMTMFAQKKYDKSHIKDIEVFNESAHAVELEKQSFDVIISINALYTMDSPTDILHKAKDWLKPKGKLFVIDWGRENQILDWAWYMARNAVRIYGIKRAIAMFYEGYEVVKQNKHLKKEHQKGIAWVHSIREFENTLEQAGFQVESSQVCYRGYSDLAVCTVK